MRRARGQSRRDESSTDSAALLAFIPMSSRTTSRAKSSSTVVECGGHRYRIPRSLQQIGMALMVAIILYSQIAGMKRILVTTLRLAAPLVVTSCPSYQVQDKASHIKNAATTSNFSFGVAFVHLPDHNPRTDDARNTNGLERLWKSPDNREMVQLAIANRLEYATRHQYEFLNGTDWAISNYERCRSSPKWTKILYLQSLLHDSAKEHLDWILYLDTDALIMNHEMPLTALLTNLQPNTDGLVVTMDADYVNTGAFLIANNEMGRAIVDTWAMGHKHSHTTRGGHVVDDQEYFERIFDTHHTQTLIHPPTIHRANGEVVTIETPIRYHVVPPCWLQSGGGLEYSKRLQRLFWEGFYVRGHFAVHFFVRPDKLEQLKLAASGSLGFFS